MTQYMLTIYQPDGPPPPPEVLEAVVRELHALNQDLKAAGSLGLQPRPARPEHGHGGPSPRRGRDDHRRPLRRGQGAHRRVLDRRRAPTSTPPSAGRAERARATTLPIEVRPFQDRASTDRRLDPAPASEIERVFRAEHGRAVAVLVRVFGDIDVAEEAVADAFAIAVQRWPADGLPPSPAGWIITTARNRAIDRLRREASRDDRHAQAALLHVRDGQPWRRAPVRDDRLRLIFTCCHPALGRGAQVALTLRLLGGLDHRGDRARLPGPGADHGPAPGPRQGQDPRREDPLPRPRRRRPPRPAAVGAGRRLPRLQRRLRGQLGSRARPRGPVRRGHPPRPAARRAHARRAGGAGAARADAARRVAARGPDDRRRRPRAARRPGSRAAGTARLVAEGQAIVRDLPAAQPARRVPDPGGDRRRAQRRGRPRRPPTGRRSCSSTTSCSRSTRARSSP